MTAGARFKNQNQIIQIDSSYVNACLIAKARITSQATGLTQTPYFGGVTLPANANMAGAPPIVLVRPGQAGAWVGCVTIGPSDQSPNVYAYGSAPFDIAVFSTSGTPMASNSKVGMIVRSPSTGQVVFDSRRGYPRLQASTLVAAGDQFRIDRWPSTMSAAFGSEMPWFLGNSLPWSPFFGPYDEGIIGLFAAYDTAGTATFNVLDCNKTDGANFTRPSTNLSDPVRGFPILQAAGIGQPWENY